MEVALSDIAIYRLEDTHTLIQLNSSAMCKSAAVVDLSAEYYNENHQTGVENTSRDLKESEVSPIWNWFVALCFSFPNESERVR